MQKESIVWSVGCLFISLLLMLPSTSLADDKNEKNYEELKSRCDKEQKSTDCGKFDLKFKPELNDTGTLLFKGLYLKGLYGFTNTTGTSGILGQVGMAAAITKTQKYGIGIGYKDKSIVSNIMAFFPQNPGKYTWEQDLLLDPIKLTAEVSYGKELKRIIDPIEPKWVDKYPIKTMYNIEINYTLPIDTLMYYTGIKQFRK